MLQNYLVKLITVNSSLNLKQLSAFEYCCLSSMSVLIFSSQGKPTLAFMHHAEFIAHLTGHRALLCQLILLTSKQEKWYLYGLWKTVLRHTHLKCYLPQVLQADWPRLQALSIRNSEGKGVASTPHCSPVLWEACDLVRGFNSQIPLKKVGEGMMDVGGARGSSISKWQYLVVCTDFEKGYQGPYRDRVTGRQNIAIGCRPHFVSLRILGS